MANNRTTIIEKFDIEGAILSNSLADVAEKIRETISAADQMHTAAIDKMIESGRLLVDAKEECAHGEWAAFLDRAGLHDRKAQRLMQLARSGLKSDTVTDLGGLKAALKFIAKRDAFNSMMLPQPGNFITGFVGGIDSDDVRIYVHVWESERCPGFYHVASTHFDDGCKHGEIVFAKKPLKPEPIDGYYPIWEFVSQLAGRHNMLDCEFAVVPDFMALPHMLLGIMGEKAVPDNSASMRPGQKVAVA